MIRQLIADVPEWALASLFSFVMSVFRCYMSEKEDRVSRVIVESLICGGLTMVVCSIIYATGIDQRYVWAAGGTVGSIGSATIKILALKLAHKKIDS